MSKLISKIQKVKISELDEIAYQNQRANDSIFSLDIGPNKTKRNYDLLQGRTQNYRVDILNYINHTKRFDRKIRHDTILLCEWNISSEAGFFRDKPDKEIRAFFQQILIFYSKNMDEQDIRYAQVHLDEAIPHIHMGVIPFTKDKKLNAKRVFGKTIVQNIQASLTQHLYDVGFEVEVIPTVTTSTIKSTHSDTDTAFQNQSPHSIATIPQARTLKPSAKSPTVLREAKHQLFTQEEWDGLDAIHQQLNDIKDENKSLKQKIKNLKRANKHLLNEVNLLKLKYGEDDMDFEMMSEIRESVIDDHDFQI